MKGTADIPCNIVSCSPSAPLRQIEEQVSTEGLAKDGVKSGAVFSGCRPGSAYSGMTFIFNRRCDTIGYEVSSGWVAKRRP